MSRPSCLSVAVSEARTPGSPGFCRRSMGRAADAEHSSDRRSRDDTDSVRCAAAGYGAPRTGAVCLGNSGGSAHSAGELGRRRQRAGERIGRVAAPQAGCLAKRRVEALRPGRLAAPFAAAWVRRGPLLLQNIGRLAGGWLAACLLLLAALGLPAHAQTLEETRGCAA